MKNNKFPIISIGTLCAIAVIYFAINAVKSFGTSATEQARFSLPDEITKAEALAEKGDTAALHKVILYYDEIVPIFLEVEEEIEVDENGEILREISQEDTPTVDNPAYEEYCTNRLNYWLEKGLKMNDQVALAIKGNRLYYEDEEKAIEYLGKAAETGDSRAALFCGSAYYNLGRGDEAFKYLSMAYNLGQPSAGWHLAMCYNYGIGTSPNKEKAIEVMRHAATLNYPEAVIEMKRIEPNDSIWKLKADSLGI